MINSCLDHCDPPKLSSHSFFAFISCHSIQRVNQITSQLAQNLHRLLISEQKPPRAWLFLPLRWLCSPHPSLFLALPASCNLLNTPNTLCPQGLHQMFPLPAHSSPDLQGSSLHLLRSLLKCLFLSNILFTTATPPYSPLPCFIQFPFISKVCN